MKNAIRKTAATMLAALALAGTAAAQTKIIVGFEDEENNHGRYTRKTEKLDKNGSMYFETKDESTYLCILSNTTEAEPKKYRLDDLVSLTFKDNSGVPVILAQGQAVLYPTVAQNTVNLANTPQGLKKVAIYNIAGKLLMNIDYAAGQPMNIAQLPQGMYMLKAGNQTFKFEKR